VNFPSGETPQPAASGEQLARDMIDVHGAGAAAVARDNARAAARAGHVVDTQKWLRLVNVIQGLARPENVSAVASIDSA
jgi:hypothetical protein